MDAKGQEKKERLMAALDQGMVMVHLDARRPGVAVPEHLREEAHLRLNLSFRFDPPDLSVTQWGVRSTLTFSGTKSSVAFPWTALFAITSYVTKEFWLYPDDLPRELLEQSLASNKATSYEPELAARPALRAVESPPSPAEEPPEDGPKRPPRGGHLRLVK